ncbi:MAG: putative cysteine desulfurase [bacterium ADurb.Bin400]|nr:MAG: putative cysteine desulfurase [bacterium ADurb.Bin400]
MEIIPEKIKTDFPIFNDKPELVYLDSAASSLKPKRVIDKLVEYYTQYPVNIHRGIYSLSEKATAEYEETRRVVARFIGARNENEIVFTRGTTESINGLAYVLEPRISSKDEIAVSILEHHSNLLPWQQLAARTGAKLTLFDINDDGILTDLRGRKWEPMASTKILAITYASNVTGNIYPVKDIIHRARLCNPDIVTIVDAAQAAPHVSLNVADIDCDLLAFSAHKMLGPTGVGVLYGKQSILNKLPPFHFGGEMVEKASLYESTFKEAPHKFEAGTPPIAEVIALKEAVEYLNNSTLKLVEDHQQQLANYAVTILKDTFGRKVNIVSETNRFPNAGIVSFSLEEVHPHDAAQLLTDHQIAVRAGQHCASPLHQHLGIGATLRASFYIYNNEKDVDRLVSGLSYVFGVMR